jgi:hypothetical protein
VRGFPLGGPQILSSANQQKLLRLHNWLEHLVALEAGRDSVRSEPMYAGLGKTAGIGNLTEEAGESCWGGELSLCAVGAVGAVS